MTDEQTRAKEITAALCAPFDLSLLEDKQGFTYISHEHVRQRLIDATGNQFSFAVQSIEYRSDGAIRDREDKKTGEIVGTPVCVVIGTLTISELGSRTDVGVQEMQSGSGADAAYKGAASDALKRCAMSFGVGLKQLYIDKGRPPVQNAPQPRQTNGTPPVAVKASITTGELADEQFIAAYIDARNRKARAEITALMDRPDTTSDRWCGLVHAAQTVKELDNLISSMTDRQIPSNPKFERAVAERRKNLAGIEVPA